MDDNATFPVAVWVQTGDSMTMLASWDIPRDGSMGGRDVMQGVPAMLRTAAIAVELHNEGPPGV